MSDKEYAGCPLLDIEDGQKAISELLNSEKPFAVVRTSYVEFSILIRNQTKRLFGIDTNRFSRHTSEMTQSLVGPGDDEKTFFKRFVELYERSLKEADVIAVWNSIIMGDSYLQECYDLSDKRIVTGRSVEPFYKGIDVWSKALAGKKVVVVSPFDKEIKSQYEKRELLWDDSGWLPEFELRTVESIWYFAKARDERFRDWFEALDYLYKEVMKEDFDVALLGCGKFASPLAMMVKNAGKQAIQMGGALQILFGIKGKRWDDYSFYNEHWIRPEKRINEKAVQALDAGCYW